MDLLLSNIEFPFPNVDLMQSHLLPRCLNLSLPEKLINQEESDENSMWTDTDETSICNCKGEKWRKQQNYYLKA